MMTTRVTNTPINANRATNGKLSFLAQRSQSSSLEGAGCWAMETTLEQESSS